MAWQSGRSGGGAPGATGATGKTGSPGADGDEGPEGQQGPPGAPGAAGTAGTAGGTGSQGPTGPAVFLEADQGEQGDPGPPGATGAQGAAGTPGTAGGTGSQGPAGPAVFLEADAGEEGAQGPPGPVGPQGAPGAGTTGAQGPTGPAIFLEAEQPADEGLLPASAPWGLSEFGNASVANFGDAANTGLGPGAARYDHRHGMPTATLTKRFFVKTADMQVDASVRTQQGTAPDSIEQMLLADAATQGVYFVFMVPGDWSSGAFTYQIYYAPGSVDAVAHTIRWSTDVIELVPGTTSTVAAGVTTAFTGASIARGTIGTLFGETAQTLMTPAAVGNLIRVNIRRVGADAADTYVGAVRVHGVQIVYTGSRN